MRTRSRAIIYILGGLSLVAQAQEPSTPLAANHVIIDEALHTAGQPDAATLGRLGEQGFGLVINLAPPSARDAVAEEGKLLAAGGAAYVNIPVDWQAPTDADFDLFSAVMQGAGDRKVLVHCQLNMRASAFTFLYRVVHEGVAPEHALASMQEVWIPRDQWAGFVASTLARHGIDFELPEP